MKLQFWKDSIFFARKKKRITNMIHSFKKGPTNKISPPHPLTEQKVTLHSKYFLRGLNPHKQHNHISGRKWDHIFTTISFIHSDNKHTATTITNKSLYYIFSNRGNAGKTDKAVMKDSPVASNLFHYFQFPLGPFLFIIYVWICNSDTSNITVNSTFTIVTIK